MKSNQRKMSHFIDFSPELSLSSSFQFYPPFPFERFWFSLKRGQIWKYQFSLSETIHQKTFLRQFNNLSFDDKFDLFSIDVI